MKRPWWAFALWFVRRVICWYCERVRKRSECEKNQARRWICNLCSSSLGADPPHDA